MNQTAAVPEKPHLAPGVRLAGEMQESAFEQPPWLIEREGQGYIQVPRPLYGVAERADGEHTLDEIAREVAETDGLRLTPDNVRRLIARQLIPNGVIPTSDGTVLAPPVQSRSALAIKQLKAINATALSGLTRGLEMLFWPPVLVILVAIAAAVMVWVYGMHGVGAALHDALYFPGFVPLLFVAVVLSAGFHELGHAAALRYGGGTPRSFGLGMYLMYPVFFTDVSDNYRLRRWGRVRTDLAGFYFNLIFACGVFVAYWLTRQEALLVIIVVMNFDIIRQLVPFVRLDGYWTLADLTGVPDFLSKMGAFARAAVPFMKAKGAGARLPALKWWARVVFLLYMLVAIPAMLVLLVVTVRNVPRVLVTAWDSLGHQGNTLLAAASGPDLLAIGGSLGQSVLIVLPVAGLLYSLYRIGNSAVISGWRWSEGSVPRRGVFGVASVAALVVVYAMWAPQFPFPGDGPSALYSPSTFQPFGADERLSLGDALSGSIVERAEASASTSGVIAPATTASSLAGAPASQTSSTSSGSALPSASTQSPQSSTSTRAAQSTASSDSVSSAASGSSTDAPSATVSGSAPAGAVSAAGDAASAAGETVAAPAEDASAAVSATVTTAVDQAPASTVVALSNSGPPVAPGLVPTVTTAAAQAVPQGVPQVVPTVSTTVSNAVPGALPRPTVAVAPVATAVQQVGGTASGATHAAAPAVGPTAVASVPTVVATVVPTVDPTIVTTAVPTVGATAVPTVNSTVVPTALPTALAVPSAPVP